MSPTAFFTVHSDLPREGPGLPDDVAWALAETGLSGPLRVLDAGCGPGADSETLAELLPEARIVAVDTHAPFVEAARRRLARFGDRVTVSVLPMQEAQGPFDLIWCAGALYFLGIERGLSAWRGQLAESGVVAFSEPVIVRDTPGARAFWSAGGEVSDQDGIRARIAAAGFGTLAERVLTGAPWEAYYGPMQDRLERLRASSPDGDLRAAIDAAQSEIDLWKAAPGDIAYLLSLVRPT